MKKYWIKDLNEHQVIHAPTEDIAKKLCKKFSMLGLTWGSGKPYPENSRWDEYRVKTCYSPSDGQFCKLRYSIQGGYEILTIDQLLDFQNEEKAGEYKLIKEYPGSPKLGTIVTKACDYEHYNFNGGDLTTPITGFFVENYPEFWEKVVEKDYEILSIYDKINGTILTDFNVQIWIYNPITRQNWGIYSVKRLSDGEIFTVGDKIILNRSNNKREIHSFVLNGDSILICDTISIRNAMWCLSDINKNKPLFTTEDGIDIYEGDKYFELALSFEPQFRGAIYECTGRPNINYDYNTLKGKKKLNEAGRYYFSTKESAEEYILMNKPCLSINEVMNITYNPTETFTSTSNKLKELVKSKI